MQRRLGHAVRRAAAQMGDTRDAADVDDCRSSMLRQQWMRITRQFERRKHVGFENAAPFVLGVVDRGAGDVAAGVVDQQMQAIGMVFHPVQNGAALFIVGHIGGQPVQFALGKLVGKLIARLRQGIGIARHHQQVGAEAKQFARDGKTNPGAGASDEGSLSIQPPTVRCHVGDPLQSTGNGHCNAVDAYAWPGR
ncbi:hypothetical protein XAP6984_800056 [Xanthomonas phaseoli pv. phaseoli]|uniref:Uncharacterized protein n=1 Tax=Xanthomonas campestris pv. phaseoli TaxID=317013 RepID=A0ABY1TWY3_XANCH|nr:hypothetical protein XAP6984_800056 [Xanthomonas phaseoli pv. phaseoli]